MVELISQQLMPQGHSDMAKSLPSGPVDPQLITYGDDSEDRHYDSRYVPKTWLTNPFSMLENIGMGYQKPPSALTMQTLHQMSVNHGQVASIILTYLRVLETFAVPQVNKYARGFRIRHRDHERRLTDSERNHIRYMEHWMMQCGERPRPLVDLPTLIKRMGRDRLTYDQTCFEPIYTYGGRPWAINPVPGNTIRVALPKHRDGFRDCDEISFVQVVNNEIVNTYTSEQLAFRVANNRTDIEGWYYPMSELELLVRTVTSHLWAEEWNRRAFSQGSTTKGLLNIQGNMSKKAMDSFRSMWMQQVSGVTNAWRAPIINSQEPVSWVSLQPTNDEMGYSQWMEYLTKTECGIYQISPSAINMASVPDNDQITDQQRLSRIHGLRPMLHGFAHMFNVWVMSRFGPEWVFEFMGIDAKTEEQAIELRLKELQSYKTLNEVREVEQLPPVPHGDIVPNPSYIGYRNQKEMMAAQSGGGAPGGGQEQPEPTPEGEKAGERLKRTIGDKSGVDHESSLEPWDEMAASLPESDLMKALGPLDDLFDD